MKLINKLYIIAIAVICIAIVIIVIKACNFVKGEHTVSQTVALAKPTPVNLDSIKRIGQWSVVTVEMDQVVDTVDHGFFHDYDIELMYHGTLHYGVNMSKVSDDWVRTVNDSTVIVSLPAAELLDNRFLDERNVKVILGEDDQKFVNRPEVKAALAAKAKAKMMDKGKVYVSEAESKIEEDVRNLFLSHGYKEVTVSFVKK